MPKLKNILQAWLPLLLAVTAGCALVYATVQQALRQGLNDPQIQMAEDAGFALDQGATVDFVVTGPKVEVSRSLAPFLVAYTRDGKPLAGSGLLDGQLPSFPQGALAAAQQTGENRVSWQPNPSVRIAAVIVPYNAGYVVAGRNMREVEQRIASLGTLVALTWLVTLAATLLMAAAGELRFSGKGSLS